MSTHQFFLLREHVFLWDRDRDFFLLGILLLCFLSVSYLEEEIFSRSLPSGITLLNSFTKTSKFGVGFDNNDPFF